jgi:hypothetical protein
MYMTRKTVKINDIIDHLLNNAIEYYEPLNFDFREEDLLVVKKEEELDQWTMYFDGVVNIQGNGAKVVIVFPNRKQYPVSIKLQYECTNNTAEYEACILGLEVVLELKINKFEVYGYSILIIC